MTFKKNNPGCGCCGTCDIGSDDFDRGDSTSIGADWSEEAGDWEISSNQLYTADTNAYAEFQTAHPDSEAYFHVQVDITISVGDRAQIVFADNVVIEIYRYSSSTYKVIFKDGGSSVSTQDVSLSGSSYTYTAFYSEGTGLASLFFGNNCAHYGILTAPTTYVAGLGTGSSNSSGIYFDDFVFSKGVSAANPSCENGCWDCGRCSSVVPLIVPVTLSGWTTAPHLSCTTGECAELDATFQVPMFASNASACQWLKTFTGVSCQNIFISVTLSALGLYNKWLVTVQHGSGIYYTKYNYEKLVLASGGQVDCEATHVLTFSTAVGSAFYSGSDPAYCSQSGVTCQIF